jgi:SAM-dependent methyltransferase
MIVVCPNCGTHLENNSATAEQVVVCPHCSGQFQMPELIVSPAGERPSSAFESEVFIVTSEPQRPVPVFLPEVFEVKSVKHAMAMILTAEPGTTTQERWEKETPYLVEDIGRFLAIGPDSCVLDYGCGIGRIARPLVEKFGCRVVGVDASESMRLMAPQYVRSDRFVVWSPEVLDEMIRQGFQADFCVCLWVIQHVADVMGVIERIARALRPEGILYAMNQLRRAVPTDQGWCDDCIDVHAALRRVFLEENVHPLPREVTTAYLSSVTRIQVLRKRASEP